jgi:Family of unknown function (DUF6328)
MIKKADTASIAQEVIEEARMVLPGIQALFGFQLIAVFNERFYSLPSFEQALHYVALVLVGVAIAVIMTPAAYHRMVEQTTVSEFFVRLASWLIAVAMVPDDRNRVRILYCRCHVVWAWIAERQHFDGDVLLLRRLMVRFAFFNAPQPIVT